MALKWIGPVALSVKEDVPNSTQCQHIIVNLFIFSVVIVRINVNGKYLRL